MRQKCDNLRILQLNGSKLISRNLLFHEPVKQMLAYDIRYHLYDIGRDSTLSNSSPCKWLVLNPSQSEDWSQRGRPDG